MKKAPPSQSQRQRQRQQRPHRAAATTSARPRQRQRPPARAPLPHESAWRRQLNRQLNRHFSTRNIGLLAGAFVVCLLIGIAVHGALGASPGASVRTESGRADTSGPCKGAGTYVSEQENVVLCLARPQLYTYTEKLLGLMAPAFDQQDSLWVGAMATNRLLRLDPRTGQTKSWPVPNGQHMVMETAVDRHGSVWFTEQGAGYIGRFDPASGAFAQYTLDPIGGTGGDGERPGPQALQFDRDGQLWFTVPKQGWIGRLDPATGTTRAYPLPARTPDTPIYPYDLTQTPDGHLWFGSLWYSGGGGAVGELDPASGSVKLYPLRDPHGKVYALAPDASGHVWFTELDAPRIGMVDPSSGTVRELDVPETLGKPTALYGVVVAHNGDVWFGSHGTSSLVRYSPTTRRFTFFLLKIGKNAPYELAFDGQGQLWFTSQGDTPSYIGKLTP